MNFADHYDHLEIAAMDDPFPALAEARNECPVVHSVEYGGFWALFGYDDISSVARDPGRFSSAQGITIPHHGFPMSLPPIETDPPQHMQLRGPLLDRFSPGAVGRLEGVLRQSVVGLIATFAGRGEADLAQELTVPLPGIAVTHLLAIPEEDRARCHEWTTALIREPENMEAISAAFAYFYELYQDRSANPRDDIPSLIIGISVDGRPISEQEFLCFISTLVMAGLDTTANAGANMLKLLAERPDLRAQLIAEPGRIPQAVEELLRYITPLPALARVTTEPVEINGVEISAGERVQMVFIAGNHDPDEFECPEEIRFDRSPNRHLAFSAGPHRCLGAHLARLELRILL
ncbi:MAG TPA: cytochrome P450, partial [Acidimicrobiia bacterium]|nr:cytochrome P450 [Acidimicrobiia bacterium]